MRTTQDIKTRMSYRKCGCEVNSPHNHTCGARAVNVRCGFFFGFFFWRIDDSKIQVSDKKTRVFLDFNEERVLSVFTGYGDKI
jgi:hypothetical protein